jgi:uncharacterized membrane protein
MTKLEGLNKKRFKLTVAGILLLTVGVVLLSYSVSAIQNQKHMLNSSDLSLEEIWNKEGSVRWLQNVSTTLFAPLTAVFLTIGGVGLITTPLVSIVRQKRVIDEA